MVVFYPVLAAKNHGHVFSKKAICFFSAQFLAVPQYLGCAARLCIQFQIVHTSLNIGARKDIMVHNAFFENIRP
jgi:hypothetical protein